MTTKTCTKCGETKNIEEFGVRRRSKDGRNNHCKDCIRAASRLHYQRRREEARRKMAAKELAVGKGDADGA